MASFAINQPVDVRYATTTTWYPGVVTGLSADGCCYVVGLDAPKPTRIQWTGISRPLGDDSPIDQTLVYLQTEQLTPGAFIRGA